MATAQWAGKDQCSLLWLKGVFIPGLFSGNFYLGGMTYVVMTGAELTIPHGMGPPEAPLPFDSLAGLDIFWMAA